MRALVWSRITFGHFSRTPRSHSVSHRVSPPCVKVSLLCYRTHQLLGLDTDTWCPGRVEPYQLLPRRWRGRLRRDSDGSRSMVPEAER
eukprot:2352246-Pyramimonas_sp.AAC.1